MSDGHQQHAVKVTAFRKSCCCCCPLPGQRWSSSDTLKKESGTVKNRKAGIVGNLELRELLRLAFILLFLSGRKTLDGLPQQKWRGHRFLVECPQPYAHVHLFGPVFFGRGPFVYHILAFPLYQVPSRNKLALIIARERGS